MHEPLDEPVFIDLLGDDDPSKADGEESRWTTSRLVAVLAVVVLAAAGAGWLAGDGVGSDERNRVAEPPRIAWPEPVPSVQEIPVALRAAEEYASDPSADSLHALFESIGGFEGLQVGEATGAFDVVTFDPLDENRLLAAHRAGYGAAENQHLNQEWSVDEGSVSQTAWRPETLHDFVHFNRDGTTTMWVHSGDEVGFAPRIAVVIDRAGDVITTSSSALYADRFAVDAGTIFVLTGDPDWYSTRRGYRSLIADDGQEQTLLAPGDGYGWIDVPRPGIVVAYPAGPEGVTAVWDSQSLEPLVDHPLAGRPYQRVAVSADETTALAVTADGKLEPLDLETGRTGPSFGAIDVRDVDRPVTLSRDGRVAYTVESSGTVSIWFVGDDAPIATQAATGGIIRWLPTSRSALLASSLAPDSSRVALRSPARPGIPVSWQLIDTEIESWLDRACAVAGRGLSAGERDSLGLPRAQGVCS